MHGVGTPVRDEDNDRIGTVIPQDRRYFIDQLHPHYANINITSFQELLYWYIFSDVFLISATFLFRSA